MCHVTKVLCVAGCGVLLIVSPGLWLRAQDTTPRPLPPGTVLQLQQLSAAAKRQNENAAAKTGLTTTQRQTLGLAAVQHFPVQGRLAMSSKASQAHAIQTVRQNVGLRLPAGSPAYAQQVDQQLLQLKAAYAGKPLALPAVGVRPAVQAPAAQPAFAGAQQKLQQAVLAKSSLYNDPAWLKNRTRLVDSLLQQDLPFRSIGGHPTSPADFLDCVAVVPADSVTGCGCSGVLIGKNVVLSAAHCLDDGCNGRVFIGTNVNSPGQGQFLTVKEAIKHPDYNSLTGLNDLAMLILAQDIPQTVPIAKLATTSEVDGATENGTPGYVVGFGVTTLTMNDYGVKSQVQVAFKPASSYTPEAASLFGFHPGTELVAGGNGHDACNGDSGGPLYIKTGTEFKLVGLTSRATNNSHVICGDGGIFTRVDAYLQQWILPTASAHGGRVP